MEDEAKLEKSSAYLEIERGFENLENQELDHLNELKAISQRVNELEQVLDGIDITEEQRTGLEDRIKKEAAEREVNLALGLLEDYPKKIYELLPTDWQDDNEKKAFLEGLKRWNDSQIAEATTAIKEYHALSYDGTTEGFKGRISKDKIDALLNFKDTVAKAYYFIIPPDSKDPKVGFIPSLWNKVTGKSNLDKDLKRKLQSLERLFEAILDIIVKAEGVLSLDYKVRRLGDQVIVRGEKVTDAESLSNYLPRSPQFDSTIAHAILKAIMDEMETKGNNLADDADANDLLARLSAVPEGEQSDEVKSAIKTLKDKGVIAAGTLVEPTQTSTPSRGTADSEPLAQYGDLMNMIANLSSIMDSNDKLKTLQEIYSQLKALQEEGEASTSIDEHFPRIRLAFEKASFQAAVEMVRGISSKYSAAVLQLVNEEESRPFKLDAIDMATIEKDYKDLNETLTLSGSGAISPQTIRDEELNELEAMKASIIKAIWTLGNPIRGLENSKSMKKLKALKDLYMTVLKVVLKAEGKSGDIINDPHLKKFGEHIIVHAPGVGDRVLLISYMPESSQANSDIVDAIATSMVDKFLEDPENEDAQSEAKNLRISLGSLRHPSDAVKRAIETLEKNGVTAVTVDPTPLPDTSTQPEPQYQASEEETGEHVGVIPANPLPNVFEPGTLSSQPPVTTTGEQPVKPEEKGVLIATPAFSEEPGAKTGKKLEKKTGKRVVVNPGSPGSEPLSQPQVPITGEEPKEIVIAIPTSSGEPGTQDGMKGDVIPVSPGTGSTDVPVDAEKPWGKLIAITLAALALLAFGLYFALCRKRKAVEPPVLAVDSKNCYWK